MVERSNIMNAIIKLDSTNHEMRKKSICLHTIFGDVYTPISKTKIINDTAIVPFWVFHKAGLNPCQMVTGFQGTLKEEIDAEII